MAGVEQPGSGPGEGPTRKMQPHELPTVQADVPDTAGPPVPEQIGQYRIVRLIGRGGDGGGV